MLGLYHYQDIQTINNNNSYHQLSSEPLLLDNKSNERGSCFYILLYFIAIIWVIENLSMIIVRFYIYIRHIYTGGDKVVSEEFEKIYQLYFKDVYYYILSLSKDEQLSEDITSETFLKVMNSIDTFRGDTKLRVWICQIAKNEYFSYLRKNKRMSFVENLDDLVDTEDIHILEKDIISRDEFARINKIIDSSLQEPYAEIFRLRVYEELSFKEIGNLFGKTDNWACVIYYRARKKIQSKLEGNK